VAFSPDGATLATGDSDGSTYLWSTASDAAPAALADPGGAENADVDAVAFSPSGGTLAVGGFDGSAFLYSLTARAITALISAPDGPGVPQVAGLATRSAIAVLDAGRPRPYAAAAAFVPGARLLVTISPGNVYLWSLPEPPA
jgi:WD40 repeat protein